MCPPRRRGSGSNSPRGSGPGSRRWLLGPLLSVTGMVVVLFAAVDAVSGPTNLIDSATVAHGVALVVGTALFICGNYLLRDRYRTAANIARMNGARSPNSAESVLRRQDYNVSSDPQTDEPTFEYDDGAVYVHCQQCGERNEQGFAYCVNCSTELPS